MSAPRDEIVRFITKSFDEREIDLICHQYLSQTGYSGLGMTKNEKVHQLLDYCQERYLIFELLMKLQEANPLGFVKYIGERFSNTLYRYGDWDRIKPPQGSVLLDPLAFFDACTLLRRGKMYQVRREKGIRSLACLMQVMEAMVINEQVYVFDSTLPLVGTGLDKFPELFRNLPKSFEIEDEVAGLKASKGQLFLVTATDPDYALVAAAKVGLSYRYDPEKSMHSPPKKYYTVLTDHVLENIKTIAMTEIDKMNLLLAESRFSIETPIIFNYILNENQARTETLIETTLRIRESKEARAFRKFCGEFDLAARVGDDKSLYRLKTEIDKACDNLKIKSQQPTLEFDIQFPLSISLNPVEVWRFIQHKRKRHLIFIDRLYQAALQSKDYYHQRIRTFR